MIRRIKLEIHNEEKSDNRNFFQVFIVFIVNLDTIFFPLFSLFFFLSKTRKLTPLKMHERPRLKIDSDLFAPPPPQSFRRIYEESRVYSRVGDSCTPLKHGAFASTSRKASSLSFSLPRHKEWEILQTADHCFTSLSSLFAPHSISFLSLLNLLSPGGEKRSRFRTMRKRCTCKRIDVSPSLMTAAAVAVSSSS